MNKWQIYEEFKKILRKLDLTPKKYKEAIDFIVDLLEL